MTDAVALPTNMGGWPPVTLHYQVGDSYLAVTMLDFLGAQETNVFEADADGGSASMTPIASFPAGTTYAEALAELGHTIVESETPEE